MYFNPEIANQFLHYLTTVDGGYLANFLKENFNVVDEELVKYYELKLEKEQLITTKQISSIRKLCQLTEQGHLFLFEGGYPVESFNDVIPEDEFIYLILRELSNNPNTLSTINEKLGAGYSKSDLERIEKSLYRKGFVDLKKMPAFGYSLSITSLGIEEFAKRTADTINNELEKTLEPKNPVDTKLNFIKEKFQDLLIKLKDSPEMSQAFENTFLEIKNLARQALQLNAIDNFSKINSATISKSELEAETQNIITNIELKLIGGSIDLSNLHPEIRNVSEAIFLKQHYREAVNNAFVRLIEIVKSKYPIPDSAGKKLKDGADLMQEVFSKDKAKFVFSSDPNEQQGMMYLYAGAVAGIRNRYSHNTKDITDQNYALELLHFASALVRLFENKAIY